jgi:hypothetical protein
MTEIPAIQDAIRRLSTEELAEFRRWFAEFDTATWDTQFENDARSGRLDRLADDAAEDLRQGRCTEL